MSLYPTPTTTAGIARAFVRDRIWQNSSRTHLDAFMADAGRSLAAGARVLDAGAGVAPYRAHFGHTVYETADFCQVDKAYAAIDYVCDLTDIPVADESYDGVLLTQVIEHVPDPRRVLSELHRVLKPGGRLWLTGPLFYAEHEQPHDYYRYTQFGLRHLLAGAGFEVDSVSWLEGYAGTVSYQLKEAVLRLPHTPSSYGGGVVGATCTLCAALLRLPLFAFAALLAAADVKHRYVLGGQCKNYKLMAHRPPDGQHIASMEP